MSNYPSQIDILPTVVPNAPIALIPGSVLNAYSAAISNIENAVGIDPAGPYTNVSERFTVLENVIGNIKINLSIPSSPFIYDHTDLSGSLNIDGTINNVNRPTVIGIQGYPVSSVAPSLYNVLTWNGIAWEPLPVITLQGRPVSAIAPTAGYVLTWTGTTWAPAPASGGGGGGNFTAGGDLSGIATFQTVIGIQGISVSNITPISGQVLEYNGSNWIPTNLPAIPTSLPPNGAAGGDLSGIYPNPTVSKLQGNPVQSQSLGVGQDGYTLVWNGTTWLGEQGFSGTAAGGDLSADYPNPVVAGIGQVKIPLVSTSNPPGTTGFVVGNVLQVTNVTANNATLGYGTLNLSSNVSGTLSNSFQQAQSVGNNLSGTTNNATVIKIQNIPVENTSLGLAQDGYVLTYVNSAGQWEPQPSTTGSSLAGDVTGSITSTTVAAIQGHTISASSPSNGDFLEYNGSVWSPQTITVTLSGDVTGSATLSGTVSTTVDKIRNNPVKAQTLGSAQDGYILTWINNDNEWEAIPNGGGSGAFVAGGDLSGSSVDQTVIKINGTSVPASPSANDVLIASNSTTATWGLIVDANVSSGAAITGSKINTSNTGGITSIFASNTIEASTIVGTSSVWVGSGGTPPTITSGSGLPSSTPPDGSIYLRTDGTSDGTESIYSFETGVWVPVGSAAAGAAGGDLFGFYPNPEVTGILNHALPSLSDGYLYWSGSVWEFASISGNFTAGGDLSGTSTNQTVIAIQNHAVASTLPTEGQFLIEGSGSQWKPTSISGDILASVSSPGSLTVIALQGNAVLSQSLSSVNDGYVLTWHNASSQWEALPSSGGGGFTAGGDLSGTSTNQTVIAINGTSVPASPSANQVLVATSSTVSTWEQISNAQVSGIAAIAVSKLASGTSAQILLNSSTPTPTWTSITGDISINNTGVTTVNKIQGVVISGTPSTGQILTATSSTAADWQNAPSGSFSAGGDLSGSSSSQTVIGIQGVPISNTSPTNNYVLTYDSGTGKWEPQPSGGGGSGPIIQDSGTVGANIRLDTSLAAPIDNTQSGIVSLGEFINSGTSILISNITNNGGFVQITLSTPSVLFGSGSVVNISGVLGTTEANGTFSIQQRLSQTIFIIPVTFVNTYISGGTVTAVAGVFGSYSGSLSGDQNYIDGYYGSILSGLQNTIYHTPANQVSLCNVIVGGLSNTILVSGASDGYNTIINGWGNTIGFDNVSPDNSSFNTVEGAFNIIGNNSSYSHLEGSNNTMSAGSQYSHIEGSGNSISGGSVQTSHIEGVNNTLNASSVFGVHMEGSTNVINSGNYTHIEGFNNIINADVASACGENAYAQRESQQAYASGQFNTQGDAQVNNLVLRGSTNGSSSIILSYGKNLDQSFNLVSTSTTIIVEAIAQNIANSSPDYATFQQTHLVYGLSTSSPVYVGCAPYLSGFGPFAISNAQDNGGGEIQITTTFPNNFVTGQTVTIAGVTGTTEANGVWTISVIDSSDFSLNGSTFSNSYISGGTASIPNSILFNGGPPTIATNNGIANPFVNWRLVGGLDGSGNFTLTLNDNSGNGTNVSIAANVRFIENNSP